LEIFETENADELSFMLDKVGYRSIDDFHSEVRELYLYFSGKKKLDKKKLKEIGQMADRVTTFVIGAKNVKAFEEKKKEILPLEEVGKKINFDVGNGEKNHPVIDGLQMDVGDFHFDVLPYASFRHLTVGIETNCCQRIGGAGEEAAVDSLINPLAGVLIMEKGKLLLTQSYFHYVPQDNGIILDNIESNEYNVRETGVSQADIGNAYVEFAKAMREKFNLKYFVFGKEYTYCVDRSTFKTGKMKTDPRFFAVEDKYTDFHYNDFCDLLAPRINKSTIEKKLVEEKMELGKQKNEHDFENKTNESIDNLKNASSMFFEFCTQL